MSQSGVLMLAVGTGVVVIVVAVAVVLIVLLITASMRGRQKRTADRRGEAQHRIDEADERAARAEHERDVAEQGGPDR